MLSNDDFRAFLRPPPPSESKREVKSVESFQTGYKHAASFAVQRKAAAAVALAYATGTSLRSSHALSNVPANQRRAVFACAIETLKELRALKSALCSSSLGSALVDDLVDDAEARPTIPEERSLALACVLLHDLVGQRWLDRSQRAASQILNHRSDLVARFQAAAAAVCASAR